MTAPTETSPVMHPTYVFNACVLFNQQEERGVWQRSSLLHRYANREDGRLTAPASHRPY